MVVWIVCAKAMLWSRCSFTTRWCSLPDILQVLRHTVFEIAWWNRKYGCSHRCTQSPWRIDVSQRARKSRFWKVVLNVYFSKWSGIPVSEIFSCLLPGRDLGFPLCIGLHRVGSNENRFIDLTYKVGKIPVHLSQINCGTRSENLLFVLDYRCYVKTNRRNATHLVRNASARRTI